MEIIVVNTERRFTRSELVACQLLSVYNYVRTFFSCALADESDGVGRG